MAPLWGGPFDLFLLEGAMAPRPPLGSALHDAPCDALRNTSSQVLHKSTNTVDDAVDQAEDFVEDDLSDGDATETVYVRRLKLI